MKTILLTQTLLVILLNPVHGQLVYRDPSFGTGGVDTLTYMSGNMDEAPWDIALLPNGRILVLGYSDDGENEEYPWIARLKANGELDKSFGTSGVKVIDTKGYYHDLRDIAIQPDGKILINGSLNRGFAIYRMDSLGVMDQSFGTGGLTNINFCSMDAAQEIAVSKSGKIAAVGYSCEFNAEFIIALFNPDGSLDLNFNGTGYFTSAFNKAFRVFQAVKFQSDRKIVAAGDCIASDVSMRTKIYVVRIDTTGHLYEVTGG